MKPPKKIVYNPKRIKATITVKLPTVFKFRLFLFCLVLKLAAFVCPFTLNIDKKMGDDNESKI